MLRKCWILLCCLITALSLGIFADAASLEKKFYKDKDEVFVFNYKEEYGITAPGYLDKVSYEGYLALKELDLDGDNNDELLAIRIGEDPANEANGLYADIYIRYDGEWDKRASYQLAENVLKYEEADCTVFLLEKNRGYFLGCEHKESASVTTQSFLWSFCLTSFDSEPFHEVLKYNFDHALSTKEVKNLKKKFKKFNLDFPDINVTSICDTLKLIPNSYATVCSIKRERTKHMEALLKHMNSGDGTPYKYGNTIFKSNVNKDWRNKNEDDFSGASISFDDDEDDHDKDDKYDEDDEDDDTSSDKYDSDYYEDFDDDSMNDSDHKKKDTGIEIETKDTKKNRKENSSSEKGSSSSRKEKKDPYLSDYSDYKDEFIFWDSSVRLLTEEELWNIYPEDLRYARNEIYARHGRIFDNYELSQYFNSLSWYEEVYSAKTFDYEFARKHFNDIEIMNIDLIKAYEEAIGY